MHGSPFLGARLGEQKRPGRKIEAGVTNLSADFRFGFLPVKASRNHKMDDDVQSILKLKHNPLSYPPYTLHDLPACAAERGIECAQDERIAEPDVLEALTFDPGLKAFNIDRQIGELRHNENESWKAVSLLLVLVGMCRTSGVVVYFGPKL
jgi:hypothetical protein